MNTDQDLLLGGNRTPSVLAVVGTTGVGKSDLAVELAVALDGEIINTDSMQVYAGYEVTTNKHPLEKQKGIPHHLLGHVPIERNYSILDFTTEARAAIEDIHSRGKVAILVGGTQYYVQAALWKDELISDTTLPDPVAEEGGASSEGEDDPTVTSEALHQRLALVDPAMAEQWHPRDRRKIARSLAIFHETGRRHSDILAAQKRDQCVKLQYPTCVLWLHAERPTIVKRLEDRVDTMMEEGMLDEVRLLHQSLPAPLDYTQGIAQGIGFKEFDAYIEAEKEGGVPEDRMKALLDEGVERVKSGNRMYAKRQVSWIKNKLLPRCSDAKGRIAAYVLDATDISAWGERARDPAIRVSRAFLEGAPLPEAKEIHPLAEELLAVPEKEEEDVKMIRCELCGIYSRGKALAKAHTSSRKHRRNLKLTKRHVPHPRSKPTEERAEETDDLE